MPNPRTKPISIAWEANNNKLIWKLIAHLQECPKICSILWSQSGDEPISPTEDDATANLAKILLTNVSPYSDNMGRANLLSYGKYVGDMVINLWERYKSLNDDRLWEEHVGEALFCDILDPILKKCPYFLKLAELNGHRILYTEAEMEKKVREQFQKADLHTINNENAYVGNDQGSQDRSENSLVGEARGNLQSQNDRSNFQIYEAKETTTSGSYPHETISTSSSLRKRKHEELDDSDKENNDDRHPRQKRSRGVINANGEDSTKRTPLGILRLSRNDEEALFCGPDVDGKGSPKQDSKKHEYSKLHTKNQIQARHQRYLASIKDKMLLTEIAIQMME